MAIITFRAFSHLRQAFRDKGVVSARPLEVPDGINVSELMHLYGLDDADFEAVFINHQVVPRTTVIQDGDRVSIIPPGGIPGHVAGYIGQKGIE